MNPSDDRLADMFDARFLGLPEEELNLKSARFFGLPKKVENPHFMPNGAYIEYEGTPSAFYYDADGNIVP
jgi:hypothetical protein